MDKCAIKCFVRFIATNNPKLFSLPSSLPLSLSPSLSPPLSTVNTDTQMGQKKVSILVQELNHMVQGERKGALIRDVSLF